MSLETQVAALTTATTDLLEAVNTSKATLDQATESATAQAATALAQSGIATTKASEASASAQTATTQAGIATAKADIATTKANEASASAQTATTQANTAISKADEASASASTATTQANTATTKAGEASSSAAAALVSQNAAATSASNASSSATTANTKASEASGSAASALAIYGNTAAMNTAVATAQAQASLAAGYAASAGSVLQQDLSAVSAGLHRSPNAIAAMFLYDTSKDSDGGAWTEKCQHTSWYNETIYGKWLGAQASETDARCVNSTVSSTELLTNGDFSSGTTGWSTSANVTLSIEPSFQGRTNVAKLVNSSTSGITVSKSVTGLIIGNTYKISGYVYAPSTNTQTNAASLYLNEAFSNRRFAPAEDAWCLIEYYFTATGASTPVNINAAQAANTASGDIAYFDNISVREVTAQTTAANDYFQLTTDGKFYALSKNLLTSTATLATQTQWLTAGTYTLSSTTGSSGSVAISGAATASHTAGTPTTFTVATSGNVTFTVTGSVLTAQCELGSVATTYSANTSTTRYNEVFRGNKRSFPKLAAIVAEASNVTIYDLTEPGRPMWMRFIYLPTDQANFFPRNNPVCISAINSIVCFGTDNVNSNSGVHLAEFASDGLKRITTAIGIDSLSSSKQINEGIALRNKNGLTTAKFLAQSIAGKTVYSLAMTVLPDAPVDPVTGLKVPTIAVATGGGISIIQNTGTVRNSSSTSSFTQVTLTPQLLSAGRADTTWYSALNPGALGASFALSATLLENATYHSSVRQVSKNRSTHFRSNKSEIAPSDTTKAFIVQSLIRNQSTPSNGIASAISVAFNSGYMLGDSRRALLADSRVGSFGPSAELVANGNFDVDSTGWASGTNASVTIAVSNGQMTVSAATATTSQAAVYPITCEIGKTYQLKVNVLSAVGANRYLFICTNNALTWVWRRSNEEVAIGENRIEFTAAQTTYYVAIALYTLGQSITVDNVSVKEVVADRSYKAAGANIEGTVTAAAVANNAQLVAYSGFSANNYIREPYSADLDFGTGEWSVGAWVNVPTGNAVAGTIASRNHSSGPRITLGIDATNKFTATAYDGTTTRTVTTTAAYNTGTWTKVRATYTTDGTLGLTVNGQQVATTAGTPLLTLNNSNAVLTIGNSYALDAPFPGSIALLKLSATVPTTEQAQWMYEQEKQLFREGAACLLPESGNVLDLAYDDATDTWSALQATSESTWSGLVRTGTQAPSAGSFSQIRARSGVKLLARTTTNPGVDVQIPAYGLRNELVKRAESAARLTQGLVTFDYFGGFTATTINGSTALTSVASSMVPSTTNLIGCAISGTGIPANTVITGVSGTTIYMSKAATANGSSIQIATTDFNLPVGYTEVAVMVAGVLKREGSTADFTHLFDGFRETIRFAVAPGFNAWVQIQAVKEVM